MKACQVGVRLVALLGVVCLGLLGSEVARGQTPAISIPSCSLSAPNFVPDFSSNQNCLATNGSAVFPAPASATPPPAGTTNPAQAAPAGVQTVLRLTPNTTDQAGSAWFITPQAVADTFSTTFTFQLSDTNTPPPSYGPADGFAFVIQNSPPSQATPPGGATTALESYGCSLGFGQGSCTSGPGIPNSIAIGFDTYQNSNISDVSNNHVEVQSCGVNPNSVDGSCRLADVNLNNFSPFINISDGNIHTVTVTYTPPTPPAVLGTLDVILDNNDLFPAANSQPGGVAFDMTTLGLTNGTAYIGFTAATGGGDDDQDILSWTFTPQSESAVINSNTPTDLNFGGGTDNGGYNANALLSPNSPATTFQATPIPVTQAVCNQLVQQTFSTAQCFVYDNAFGPGQPGSVLFQFECPGSQTGGTCGSNSMTNFNALLGSDFMFTVSNNPNFTLAPAPPTTYTPDVGFLKGSGPNPLAACAYSETNQLTFPSNQIVSFNVTDDPKGSSKSSSGGTGSCWVVTYNTQNETPGVSIAQPANGFTYQQNAPTTASYTCSPNPANQPTTNATGPYLTVPPTGCTATDSVGGSVSNGSQFDTATLGPHTFTATVVDSATNSVSQVATYNVVASTDVALTNLGALTTTPGSKLTYLIGVGDVGSASAVNVKVTDTLDPQTTFYSASGTNVAIVTTCTTVNGKQKCSTSATASKITCTNSGNTVTCPVGSVAPLSFSDLNGAVIAVTVTVNAKGTKQNPVTIQNTATASESNADTKPGNNSQTVITTVN
jgi:uncharacterized repeat protein (TIGR01451 family)